MSRWTDLAVWVGNTINEGDGDGTPLEPDDRLSDVRGLVLHIASGFYDGTIAWQRNSSADVSSHFIVARDGRCAQMVDTADRSWAQRSGNSTWLSVELEGFAPDDPLHAKHPGWERLTDAQLEVCARLFAKAHQVHGTAKVPLQLATSPAGRGLGHHSMGAENGYDWGHSQCPGAAIKAQKPAILARAQAIASGATTPATEDDMQLTDTVKLPASVYPEGGATATVETILGWSNGRIIRLEGTVAKLVDLAKAIAAKVDIDPAELAQVEAAAKAGASAAFAEQRTQLVADIIAALPPDRDGNLSVADVETAVRSVFADAGNT